MYRQSLIKATPKLSIARRGFLSSSIVRALPSQSQPHTLEKPGKDDHNPQTENMKKAQAEKKSTSQQRKGKSDKETSSRNAGIGMQVPTPT